MAEQRYCENCRELIGRGANACAACGTYAGDVFDGRMPVRRAPSSVGPWLTLLLLIGAAAAVWFYWQQRRKPAAPPPPIAASSPIGVVRQRPGGTRQAEGAQINEAEAIRALRAHLSSIKPECLAISSQGPEGSRYRLTALDSCDGTRLGRFVVDGRGIVSRR